MPTVWLCTVKRSTMFNISTYLNRFMVYRWCQQIVIIMNYTQKLETGTVYWLKDYTAPKVFTGMIFECLITDQKIPAHSKIKKSTGIHLKDWKHEIYSPKRFGL